MEVSFLGALDALTTPGHRPHGSGLNRSQRAIRLLLSCPALSKLFVVFEDIGLIESVVVNALVVMARPSSLSLCKLCLKIPRAFLRCLSCRILALVCLLHIDALRLDCGFIALKGHHDLVLQ